MNLDPDLLLAGFQAIKEKIIIIIEESIALKKDFYLCGSLLFEVSKSLMFFDKVIDPASKLTLKNIWKGQLIYLGKIYEKTFKKGITTSLDKKITIKSGRKGNYNKLSNLSKQIQILEKTIDNKFMKWYKTRL